MLTEILVKVLFARLAQLGPRIKRCDLCGSERFPTKPENANQVTNGFVGRVWRAQETPECATLSTMNSTR